MAGNEKIKKTRISILAPPPHTPSYKTLTLPFPLFLHFLLKILNTKAELMQFQISIEIGKKVHDFTISPTPVFSVCKSWILLNLFLIFHHRNVHLCRRFLSIWYFSGGKSHPFLHLIQNFHNFGFIFVCILLYTGKRQTCSRGDSLCIIQEWTKFRVSYKEGGFNTIDYWQELPSKKFTCFCY